MAFILKEAVNDQKGIIIFTHKEYNYFTARDLKIINYVFQPHLFILHFFDYLINYRRNLNLLSRIRAKYFIGIHWGFFHDNVISENWVDFHLSAKGTVSFVDKNVFIIPLSSANFVSENFSFDINAPKYWDLVCVSRAAKFKKLDELLLTVRQLYDNDIKLRICLIVPTDKSETASKYYTNLVRDYEEMFNYTERQYFQLIKLDRSLGPLGVSSDFISYIYRHAKIFTLFSELEGESRVIKEAQKSGLFVVVNKHLKGGGKDFLNDYNSEQFDGYENAYSSIIKALERVDAYQSGFSNSNFSQIDEVKSIDVLKNYFSSLYQLNGLKFDGLLCNMDNLARRLPSHFIDKKYIWMTNKDWKNGWSDIHSFGMLKRFTKFVFTNKIKEI
jgi:hypothetical protein